MDIYKLQQDRTEIQTQYDHELRQYEELGSVTNDNLVALGFISGNPKSTLKRFYYSLKGFTLHCDTLDNRIFVFYLNNKHINISTMRDLINLINIIQ